MSRKGDVAMPSSFTFDDAHKAAFGAQVLAAPWMQALVLAQAEKGAAFAKSIAPVDTGHFKDSIEADVYIRRIPKLDTPGPGRAVGRVTANDPRADVIEHGTAKTPRHRTLGRSLGVMGQL
jgi:hypothetical protein